MKAKKLLAVLCTVFACALCFAFAACVETPVTPTEYTVTFDANGGTLTGDSTVKVKSGETITGAPTASKEEHDFDAWYTLAEGGDKINLDTYTVTADVTLYAHYKANTSATKVEVTFDPNGGVLAGNNKFEVDESGNVLDCEDPTRDGYRFLGWYTAADGGEALDPMFEEITESVTLYAHWIQQVTVTFDAGEGSVDGNATVTFDKGEQISTVPGANHDTLEFHGWYTAATGGEKVNFETLVVNENMTIYAHFGVLTMPIKNLKNHEGNKVGFRIEAEEAKGEGEPNSDNSAHPGTFLEDTANASGGHSLGYLGKAGNKVTFTFKAAAAGKAKISLVASSANVQFEYGGPAGVTMWGADQQLTGKEMTMTLNGASVTYEAILVKGATKEDALANGGFAFNFCWTAIPLGELNVVEGLNTLVITMNSDKVVNMDCLDIETSLTITSANGDAATGEAQQPAPPAPDVVYENNVTVELIIGGYEGGPAIEKAILGFTEDIPAAAIATANPFKVSFGGVLGNAKTDKVYLSDENGVKVGTDVTVSRYVTIEYAVSYGQWSFNGNLSPFTYNQQTAKNLWKDLSTVTVAVSGLTIGDTTYTKFGGEVTATKDVPCLTDWKLDGTFTETIQWGEPAADREITLKYGAYEPEALKNDAGQNALIVWLHGGGEGGVDPSIAILGNQVTGLSNEKIQNYFKATAPAALEGAYVLAPQSPTQWMDIGDGKQASSPENSVYTETLFNLIKNYAETNTDIDLNRIYVGGCSNGGWMTLELLADHGEYFAAAYPVSACYDTKYITDAMIAKLKDIPIWFTHSKNDGTLPIAEKDTTNPWNPVFKNLLNQNTNELYLKLVNAGAAKVYYSLFNTVTVGNTNYDGHWSWIYTFRDECRNVQTRTGTGEEGALVIGDLNPASTETVKLTEDGEAVTMWAWLAAQAKTPAQA